MPPSRTLSLTVRLLAASAALFCLSRAVFAQEEGNKAAIEIIQPTERAVFQRDARNEARVTVECLADPSAAQVEARWVDREAASTTAASAAWHKLASGSNPGHWSGTFPVPAGWWRLEVRAQKSGQSDQATLERFGVGEVFITCGQSNSANYGTVQTTAQDDRVSACDWKTGQWLHAKDPQPGAGGRMGSPWPGLGDLLVKKYGVPVGFLSTGVGSTTVGYWAPRGTPYQSLRKAFKAAGNRVRAVLWHQGESDSLEGTPAAEYAKTLSSIIVQSRSDLGFEVPWGVARASFHPNEKATPENQAAVREGQEQVIQEVPHVFAGPDTDRFPASDRSERDHVHFNATGLAAHAEGWVRALEAILPASEKLQAPQ